MRELFTFVKTQIVKRCLLIIGCLLGLIQGTLSQDLHFSQSFAQPLILNPARSGESDFALRFSAIHKSQWNSITKAYSSVAFSADGTFYTMPSSKLKFSSGMVLLRDAAGDGNFRTISVSIPLAATYQLPENLGSLSVAVDAGIIQHALNLQDLVFDNQYNGLGIDFLPGSGESWAGNQVVLPDVGAAIFYSSNNLSSSIDIKTGLSLRHLNNPSVSLDGTQTALLGMRSLAFLESRIRVLEYQHIIPQVLFAKQLSHTEWLLGASYETRFDNQAIHFQSVGFLVRPADALIFLYQIGWKDLIVGFSYDINYSGLFQSSSGRGGFEISLLYGVSITPAVQPQRLPFCPTYL
jgi:type IX secretion system PorP/SprF family membrane protein